MTLTHLHEKSGRTRKQQRLRRNLLRRLFIEPLEDRRMLA